jgi:hypothetical protein
VAVFLMPLYFIFYLLMEFSGTVPKQLPVKYAKSLPFLIWEWNLCVIVPFIEHIFCNLAASQKDLLKIIIFVKRDFIDKLKKNTCCKKLNITSFQ